MTGSLRTDSPGRSQPGGPTVPRVDTTDPALLPDAPEYGRAMPAFSANLLVRDPRLSAGWYGDVLGALVRHADATFAALELPVVLAGVPGRVPLMLHADSTYRSHAWAGELADGVRRGLGAELRLLGVDPDAVAAAAQDQGSPVLADAADKPHGWRECVVEDPDGYAWAVGVPI